MPVYAAFNASGECLYVGMTNDRHPALRWAEHVRRAPWAIHAVRWEVLPDLSELAATERLKPIYVGAPALGVPANYTNDVAELAEQVLQLRAALESMASALNLEALPGSPLYRDDDAPIELD